jgi:hypothetical protein
VEELSPYTSLDGPSSAAADVNIVITFTLKRRERHDRPQQIVLASTTRSSNIRGGNSGTIV